jgi:hypothetical protein
VYNFANKLLKQPQFFNSNDNQTIFVCASTNNGLYVNIETAAELDIDAQYEIGCIKEIIFDEDDRCFYILSNKYQEKLGFYVLRMYEDDPTRSKFLIKFKNKLEIGDCSLTILRNQEERIKEIVIGFKTIFINTYSTFVMDITTDED